MSTPTDDVLSQALRWEREGSRVALATVVKTWRSAPRPVGSVLAVNQHGAFTGSVSGGCVESAVVQAALRAMDDRSTQRLKFGVSTEDAWAAGLPCGGEIEIFVQPLLDAAVLEDLLRALQCRRAVALITRLSDGTHFLQDLPQPAGDSGRFPSELTPALEREVPTLVATGGEQDWFVQPFWPPPVLVVVGAVHLTQYLGPLARASDFDVHVVDPRPAFATSDRLPDARIHRDWPERVLGELGLDGRTALVALTHDPKIDDPSLVWAVRHRISYSGALGSVRAHAARKERLRALGLGESEIAVIRSPVGLSIGASTIPEIAVAIMAELIAARRRAPIWTS